LLARECVEALFRLHAERAKSAFEHNQQKISLALFQALLPTLFEALFQALG
jgi:hypothetical protein